MPTMVIAPRAAVPCERLIRYRPPVRPAAKKSETERMSFFEEMTTVMMKAKTMTTMPQSRTVRFMGGILYFDVGGRQGRERLG